MASDEFTLYDLRVEVVGCRPGAEMVCNHRIGDRYEDLREMGRDVDNPAGV